MTLHHHVGEAHAREAHAREAHAREVCALCCCERASHHHGSPRVRRSFAVQSWAVVWARGSTGCGVCARSSALTRATRKAGTRGYRAHSLCAPGAPARGAPTDCGGQVECAFNERTTRYLYILYVTS
eukprot:861530-Prymnesium_polylepis.1